MNPPCLMIPSSIQNVDLIAQMEKRLENRPWIRTYSRQQHSVVIHRADEFHFSLKSNSSDLLGYVILAKTETEHDSMEFRRIVIDQKGRGLGRYSLRCVKDYCFEKIGAYRLWLDVFTDNKRALHLYLSEGFIREGIKQVCINTDGQKAACFYFLCWLMNIRILFHTIKTQ